MDPVERYLEHVRLIASSGAAVPETSYYPTLAALLLLQPQLDASYAAVKAATYPWPRRDPAPTA